MGNCLILNDNRFENVTFENTPAFTFENIKDKIKILKVIDGDTVDIALCQSCIDGDSKKIFRYRVRLYGIDTPEKKPLKSDLNREKEIEAALQTKNALISKLLENNNIVNALFYKADKYGRLLCTFYDNNGKDINQWLIDQGYAKAYFGGTKEKYKLSL